MAKTDTPSKSKKPSDSGTKNSATDIEDVSDSEASGVLAKFMKGLKEAVTPKAEAATPAPKVTRAKKVKAEVGPTPSVLTKIERPADVPVTPPMPLLDPNIAVEPDDEVVLTDAEGRRYCRATDCDQIGMVDGYCRFHYLLYWKKIQNRKRILADGKLERYIEELTARYTDKFVELLRKDLRTEKDFMGALQELELDDSAQASQGEEDEAKTYIEEISGVAAPESRDDEGF
jgi:hypothetical protein